MLGTGLSSVPLCFVDRLTLHRLSPEHVLSHGRRVMRLRAMSPGRSDVMRDSAISSWAKCPCIALDGSADADASMSKERKVGKQPCTEDSRWTGWLSTCLILDEFVMILPRLLAGRGARLRDAHSCANVKEAGDQTAA
jgi:hypothetical protein